MPAPASSDGHPQLAQFRLVHIQLWSYNYSPEPQGIAPLTAMLAKELLARGHEPLVVAAHPHYPEPKWGTRLKPYRERRDGVPVLRLPLWIGRDSGFERIRQELSFAVAQSCAAVLLPAADVLVGVTPSFPALAPLMATAKLRRTPWVMWLQDIVTDGAATTGQLNEGRLLAAARKFERYTYASADRVVVISEAFRANLIAKGVPTSKIELIRNPSSRDVDAPNDIDDLVRRPPKVLAMGNIGHSQGLDRIVEAWNANPQLADLGATLVIAGGGVAADDVRALIGSRSVQIPGVLYGPELEPELRGASIGLVSQRADISEFNLPSKLMNYLAYGIPVIASVNPESETARIVLEAGAGWVTDAAHPQQFAEKVAEVIRDRDALRRASAAGFAYAQSAFAPAAVSRRFERVLSSCVAEP